ncbi:MAG: hypothetical protein Kow0077_18150 [Anaerolineae bacterium]
MERERVRVAPLRDYANIRQTPNGADIGNLTDARLAYRSVTSEQAGNWTWHYYEFVDGDMPDGWIAAEVVRVEAAPLPDPVPDPMPPERWLPILEAQRDLYDQYARMAGHMRDLLQEEIDRLQALLDGE